MSLDDRADEIASAYDRWSRTYESAENPTRDLAAVVLRQRLSDLHGRDILEIGCGTGLNTRHLVLHSRSVLAVDSSAAMLDQARGNVSTANVRFEQRDIRGGWGLHAASVDLVVCILVLEHVEELSGVFREAARVLRPEGEFFVCELHPFRQLLGGQAQFTDATAGRQVLVPAFPHEVSEYVNAGVRNGFDVVHLGEWRNERDTADAMPPRLLSLHLRLPKTPAGDATRAEPRI